MESYRKFGAFVAATKNNSKRLQMRFSASSVAMLSAAIFADSSDFRGLSIERKHTLMLRRLLPQIIGSIESRRPRTSNRS